MLLYSVAAIRQIEHYVIDKLGIAENELMSRAGQQAWQVLHTTWPHAKQITVLCGPGNNGGDGYVVARLAMTQGCNVDVYTVSNNAKAGKAAMYAYQQYLDAGGRVLVWQDLLASCDVIVDALFGIGLQRPLTGVYEQMVRVVNASNIPVLALDVPSGLNADSGKPLGENICEVIRADVTATFIAAKTGLAQASSYVGDIICCDLQLPPAAYAVVS